MAQCAVFDQLLYSELCCQKHYRIYLSLEFDHKYFPLVLRVWRKMMIDTYQNRPEI